jgi:mono/diheme cytochrome c family protein
VLGRVFLVVTILFLGLLAFAFYQDVNRPWVPIQQAYAQKYGQDFQIGVQQLFPKIQVNNQYVVERCITCHVPDLQKIGPQQAAQRLGPNHPAVINDAIFAKYGQDTLICRPLSASTTAASPSPSPSAAASAAASASAKPKASAAPSSSAAPAVAASASASPSASASASASASSTTSGAPLLTAANCATSGAQPYYVLDVNGNVVKDASGKPVVAQLTGFIPSQYKGLGIDETGCIICHNGNRQATDQAGAHTNLVPDPFGVYNNAPQLFEANCAQCHGATGEGGKGPPLNDQGRLAFFNDDYYYRCIYLGNQGEEHRGSIMPAWGLLKALPAPIDGSVNLLVHWIRMWQQYSNLP